jgi:hypothetical protein
MKKSLTNSRSFKPAGLAFDRSKPNTSPQIAVRFELKMINELRRRAKRDELPVARIIRDLIARALAFD